MKKVEHRIEKVGAPTKNIEIGTKKVEVQAFYSVRRIRNIYRNSMIVGAQTRLIFHHLFCRKSPRQTANAAQFR